MKKLMKRAIAIGLAATLSVAAVAATAYAYFTDQVRASGEKEVTFGYDFETDEEIIDGNKIIRIKNTGNADIAVRVFVFGADMDDDRGRTIVIADSKWWQQKESAEGLCYEYTQPLAPGQSTNNPLEVRVVAEGENAEDEFEVIVVGQASLVAYDENGKPYGYNWRNASEGN